MFPHQKSNVLDPHQFNADPNPAFHFNAYPDPDPDPAPASRQGDAKMRLQLSMSALTPPF
jgi:hypothetical protein